MYNNFKINLFKLCRLNRKVKFLNIYEGIKYLSKRNLLISGLLINVEKYLEAYIKEGEIKIYYKKLICFYIFLSFSTTTIVMS